MKTIRTVLMVLAAAPSGIMAADVHDAILTVEELSHSVVGIFNPQSYNLGDCPDNGVLNVQINNTTEGFDVTTIAGIDPETGAVDPEFAPVLIPWKRGGSPSNDPYADGRGTPIDSASFLYDAELNIIGIKMFYKTCLFAPSPYVENGFTQIVQDLNLVEDGTVDVTLRGTQAGIGGSPDTTFYATEYDHKVVKIGG